MALPDTGFPCEVDPRVSQALLSVYQEHYDAVAGARITLRGWRPASMRKIKQRTFTLLAVEDRPALICKTPLDHDDCKVAGEWRKLQGLRVPSSLRYGRGLRQVDAGFIMTFVPELDLPDALRDCPDHMAFAALLERAVDLTAQLHLLDADDVCSMDAWMAAQQYVDEPCVARPELRTAIEEALVGPTHGDLAPWNIRYDRVSDQMGFIDWEDYRPCGIAGTDIVNLLMTLGLAVFPDFRSRGMAWLYEQVLESDHWYALLVRDMIVRYAATVRRSPRVVIDLLPFSCQWLLNRISSEGRDTSPFYYDYFLHRYIAGAPNWVSELPK